MSKVRETRLWSWLSTNTKTWFKDRLHMNRIENSVSTGMPDVEGCLEGIQFWIELKCEPRPSNPKVKIKPRFQPGQAPWLRRRIKAGGRAFILLQVGAGHEARRYLFTGDMASALAGGYTEEYMRKYAIVDPTASAAEIIKQAVYGDVF